MAQQDTGPTLTNVSYIGRQTIKFGAIFLVLFMVGRTALTVFVAYWKATHPEPPPPPTVGFGVLPTLDFPEKTQDEKPVSYKLETATGGFADFGDRAKVFMMYPYSTSPSLFDDQRAEEAAAGLNYVFEPKKVDLSTYRFSKSSPVQSVFEYNVLSNHFTITSDYLSRPELLTSNAVPDKETAVSAVYSILSATGLSSGTREGAFVNKVVYMKALGIELTPALSFSEADFAEVTLARQPVDEEFSFYTPDGGSGNIRAIVTGALSSYDSVVEMDFLYQEMDAEQVQTYPIRTAVDAWKLLQAGEGYVAQKGDYDTAIIRDVELGYYDSDQEQNYMQPIYVFKGDGDFIGYVPAVHPSLLQSSIEK